MRIAIAEGVDFVSTRLINIGFALPMKPSMHLSCIRARFNSKWFSVNKFWSCMLFVDVIGYFTKYV